MAYFNSVVLVGNATKAPESHSGEVSGSPYATFSLAQKHYKAKKSRYIRVVAFDPQREAVLKYVKRGRPLLVAGRLDISDKGYASVIANRVEFLGAASTKSADTPAKAKLRKKVNLKVRGTQKSA